MYIAAQASFLYLRQSLKEGGGAFLGTVRAQWWRARSVTSETGLLMRHGCVWWVLRLLWQSSASASSASRLPRLADVRCVFRIALRGVTLVDGKAVMRGWERVAGMSVACIHMAHLNTLRYALCLKLLCDKVALVH